MVTVKVDADRVDSFKVDDRGRAYLGKEYADQVVELAIIKDEDGEE